MADIGELVIQIRASAEGVETAISGAMQSIQRFVYEIEAAGNKVSFDPVEKSLEGIGTATEGVQKKTEVAWDDIHKTTTSALGGIIQAVNQGIAVAQAYQSAMIGVQNVATQNGVGSEAMQKALDKVSDAFLDSTSAANAYRNLLTRGFSLDQATNMILRLKDAAAFGRQSSQGFAQSIVAATEGIKSENSALVSNAGVTKDVTRMWQDYAKARGLATNELTQAQKVEAEYLGVIDATAVQVGNMAKMSETMAGSQIEAANQSTLLAQSFGEAMTPVAQAATEVFIGVLSGITGISEAMPWLTAGVTGAAGAFTTLAAAASGVMALKKTIDDFNIPMKLTTPLGIAAAALGVLAGIYTAIKNEQERMAKAEEERIAANKEAVVQQQGRVKDLEELTARYQQLSGKSNLNYSEQRELLGIQNALATSYGITAANLDGANQSAQEYLATLQLLHAQELKDLKTRQEAASKDAYTKANSQEYVAQMKEVQKYQNLINEKTVELEIVINKSQGYLMYDDEASIRGNLTQYELILKSEQAKLDQYNNLFSNWFKAAVDEGLTVALIGGKTVNTAMAEALKGAFEIDLEKFGGNTQAANDWVDSMIADVVKATTEVDTATALAAVTGVLEGIKAGVRPSEEDIQVFTEAWGKLLGQESPLLKFIVQLQEATGEELKTVTAQVMHLILGFEDIEDVSMLLNAMEEDIASTTDDLGGTLTAMADHFLKTTSEINKVAGDLAENGGKDFADALKSIDKRANNVSGQKELIKEAKELSATYKKLASEGKNTSKLWDLMVEKAAAFGKALDGSSENVESFEAAIKEAEKEADLDIASITADFFLLREQLLEVANKANIDGSADMDTTNLAKAAKAALLLLDPIYARMLALGGLKGTEVPPPKGSGSRRKSKSELAEEARRAAEEARQEAIRQDYALLDHQKHLNQLSLEAELQMLYQIRQAHELNAEEIMEWERKVYDVRQELRQRDAASIDKAGEALIDALSARYQAMQDAEIQRLDASRKAWEDWRDDSVQAIRDQIAALDELSKTEDREKQDQEELRKIAKLRQDVEFEQDSYNRMKLQQQLDQAISAREDRLRRLGVEDQKAALLQQIEAIQDQAEAQFTALDSQQEEIEKAYAERMKTAALRAEAEKLLMTGSQREIVSLIGEFAPEYDALGKTLGEKLLEGFQSKVGGVVAWFQSLNDSLYQIQEQAAAEAIAAANQFQSGYQQRQQNSAAANNLPPTVVNQTVNFNEPVESAGEAAKRVRQANEELGALLYGG